MAMKKLMVRVGGRRYGIGAEPPDENERCSVQQSVGDEKILEVFKIHVRLVLL
jgi:hypothetical protein